MSSCCSAATHRTRAQPPQIEFVSSLQPIVFGALQPLITFRLQLPRVPCGGPCPPLRSGAWQRETCQKPFSLRLWAGALESTFRRAPTCPTPLPQSNPSAPWSASAKSHPGSTACDPSPRTSTRPRARSLTSVRYLCPLPGTISRPPPNNRSFPVFRRDNPPPHAARSMIPCTRPTTGPTDPPPPSDWPPSASRSPSVQTAPVNRAMRLGPGQTHHAYPMFGTTAARRLGVQDGAVLAACPNAANAVRCRGRTKGTPYRTLGTSKLLAAFMPQMHMDFPFLQDFQFHTLYALRVVIPKICWYNCESCMVFPSIPKNTMLIALDAVPPNVEDYPCSGETESGCCWEATRQGISESRMCQRHQCPRSLTLSGHSRSFLQSLWTSEQCLTKSLGRSSI